MASLSGTLKRKHTFLTIETKIEILNRLEKGESGSSLAKQYGVGKATISDIKRMKNTILNFASKLDDDDGSKLRKTTRTAKDSLLEDAVFLWFSQRRSLGEPVSGPLLCEKALYFNEKLGGPADFKASTGWLKNFKCRHGIRELNVQGEVLSSDVPAAETFKTSTYMREDASTSEGSSDPQPGTSRDPSEIDKETTTRYTKSSGATSEGQKEDQGSILGGQESWNPNEVFIKQEVDLSDDFLEDDSSMGNSSNGDAELSPVKQSQQREESTITSQPNEEVSNLLASTPLTQPTRQITKRKAALQHAYIKPPVQGAAQLEKSLVVEPQHEQIQSTSRSNADPVEPGDTFSAGQKKGQGVHQTEQERLQHEKEELEAVLLRLQLKKLLLEMEKLSEERERIAVEKSNIALRYECLKLQEKLEGPIHSVLSSALAGRQVPGSSTVPNSVNAQCSTVAHSKSNISPPDTPTKSSTAGIKGSVNTSVKSKRFLLGKKKKSGVTTVKSIGSLEGSAKKSVSSKPISESGGGTVSAEELYQVPTSSKTLVRQKVQLPSLQQPGDLGVPSLQRVSGESVEPVTTEKSESVVKGSRMPLKQTEEKYIITGTHTDTSILTNTKLQAYVVVPDSQSSKIWTPGDSATILQHARLPSPSTDCGKVGPPEESSSTTEKFVVCPADEPYSEGTSCIISDTEEEVLVTGVDVSEEIETEFIGIPHVLPEDQPSDEHEPLLKKRRLS